MSAVVGGAAPKGTEVLVRLTGQDLFTARGVVDSYDLKGGAAEVRVRLDDGRLTKVPMWEAVRADQPHLARELEAIRREVRAGRRQDQKAA